MHLRRMIGVLAVLVGLSGTAWPGDWPQWRGPQRDAHASRFKAPSAWPENLKQVWSIEAGAGLSSPVVADGVAYLLTRDGDDEVVTSYDVADGSVRWRRSYPSRFYANAGAMNPRMYPRSQGRGPFATPVVHDNHVYTLGVNRIVSAFAADKGRLKWRQEHLAVALPENVSYICPPCNCEHDDQKFDAPGRCPSCGMALNAENLETTAKSGGGNYYGAASSPLIAGKLGVVHVGNLTEGLLVGFDARTGEERWRYEGPTVAYASPVVARMHGKDVVITMTRTSVVGLDLATGKPRFSHEVDNNAHVATPVVLDDLIIASIYRGPTFALSVSQKGEAWSVQPAWENTELTQWMASPVLDGQRLHGFFFSKRGQFATLDARTGKTLWQGEGRQGPSASLVMAGRQLIALKSDGSLVVMNSTDAGLETVRTYQLADSPTWTYPALFDDRILVKDEERLTLWSF